MDAKDTTMLLVAALRVALLCLLLFAVVGCDDDPMPAQFGAVGGTVTNVRTGAALPGVTIVLVDPARIASVGNPARSAADGSYRIAGVTPGEYAAFYFQGPGFGSFDVSASTFRVEADRDTRWDVRLVPSPLFLDDDYAITGTVRDAVSGEPIAGVNVMPTIFSSWDLTGLFEGGSLPYLSVSDEAGRFTVVAVADRVDFPGSDAVGLFPLSFTRTGYLPATIVGRGPEAFPGLGSALPVPTDSVLEVEVRLRRTGTGNASGTLRGVVQFAGTPVAGLRVGLSVAAVADPDTVLGATKALPPVIASPLPDKVAVTDASGAYAISGLHPAWYYVHAAFPKGDGYTWQTLANEIPFVQVVANDTADVGETPVFRALEPLYPLPQAELTTAQADSLFLDWEVMPEPVGWRLSRYEVQASGGYLMDVVGNLRSPPLYVGRVPPGTTARWSVFAYMVSLASGDSLILGSFEGIPTFTVASPESALHAR